jgi:hypothetical protein
LAPLPLAGSADLHGRDADLGFGAKGRLLQRDFEVVAQVGTAIDVRTPAATAATAEDLVEDAAKRHRRSRPCRPARAHAGLRVDAGVAVLVVGRRFCASDRIS